MILDRGTKLGPYEIVALLGAGGMGEVYRARDTRLGRTVAIKILQTGITSSDEMRQRFERKARAVSSLNHPYICTLYDIGQQDGVDYLVMEYLEGESLAARLSRGSLPLPEALNFAIQIAAALDHAHRNGIAHRDLKPGNIMLTKSGAKLLDFGLAKLHESGAVVGIETRTLPLTGAGTLLGTLEYMSPEQLEGREADSRSDVFAFGAVMYEMITGQKAFHGTSAATVIAAVLTTNVPAVSSFQPVSTPLLDHLVRHCLEKRPDERWQSALDAMLVLQSMASSEPSTAPIVS